MRARSPSSVDEPTLGPTSGGLSGWLGEALVVCVLVDVLIQVRTLAGLRIGLAALLAGTLIWAFLLRSRVILRHEGIMLRNAFVDTFVPYGLIDRVVVRSVTQVVVGGRRYPGAGVGRSMRRMVRPMSQGTGGLTAMLGQTPDVRMQGGQTHEANAKGDAYLPDFLEEQAGLRIAQARERAAAGEVRRTPAVPEIVATVVLVIALVLSLVL